MPSETQCPQMICRAAQGIDRAEGRIGQRASRQLWSWEGRAEKQGPLVRGRQSKGCRVGHGRTG